MDNVQLLCDKLFPKVDSFSAKIDDFRIEHQVIREAVRKLDESVSMKVNRERFTDMKYDFER